MANKLFQAVQAIENWQQSVANSKLRVSVCVCVCVCECLYVCVPAAVSHGQRVVCFVKLGAQSEDDDVDNEIQNTLNTAAAATATTAAAATTIAAAAATTSATAQTNAKQYQFRYGALQIETCEREIEKNILKKNNCKRWKEIAIAIAIAFAIAKAASISLSLFNNNLQLNTNVFPLYIIHFHTHAHTYLRLFACTI